MSNSPDAVQANPATNDPTIQEIRNWDDEELLQWIQKKKPRLLGNGYLQKKFKQAYITGDVFLDHANDVCFFEDRCKLPPGTSDGLVKLARNLFGGDSEDSE